MRFLFTISSFLFLAGLNAQKLDHVLGQMIIQTPKHVQADDVARSYSAAYRSPVKVIRTLSERLGIYLIAFDHARVHEGRLLEQLRADQRITVAQYDHLTTNRSIPDDPLFGDQWQWFNDGQTGGFADSDIDAELAWDITRGGTTITGDTIVVAIIDDGINLTHPDIRANLWINHGEVPNNGVDDDANGYVDDIHGWNAYDDNPDVFRIGHGLRVAGMIGAVGNNAIGITGINWHVKLMNIVGGVPESAAIAAYAYALEQRILYHETNGERGAFVVATNSSWGIDEGQPADAPLWCAFYDSLGVHGILSAAATANNDDDIDVVGDLPTACASEYLFSVTALNDRNRRTFSAYGLEHVDFGAPGEDIFTTEGGDEYGMSSGTSFASPVAAGLVALLYSAPCLNLAQLAHTNPAAGAQYVRDIIFNGIEKIAELEDETKFGGSLNAGNSMQLLMSLCSECPIPFGITSEIVSDEEVIIDWTVIDSADAINARLKPVLGVTWDTLTNVSRPLVLTGLLECTDYEIEFESVCADTSTGFQSHHEFTTEGCCELPTTITAFSDNNSIQINWSHVFAAEYFIIEWREVGQTAWIETATSLDDILLDHLEECTLYEFRLQTNCDTSETGFSDIMQIRTKNCGNCIDLVYCEAGSDDSSDEYIDSLQIGDLVNQSGQNGGYILYAGFNPVYVAGNTYDVFLRPGFGFSSFDEQFRIWLDANQDGVFDDSELLLDSVLEESNPSIMSAIVIPDDALEGNTRMRVSMSFFDFPNNVNQPPCGNLEFGEVEDYCVTIVRTETDCPRVDTLQFDGITFTGAFMYWPSVPSAIAYTYRYREEGASDYMELATIDTTANLSGLTKCTTYEVQIRTICLTDTTAYDSVYLLTTECEVAVEDPSESVSQLSIYPNPFTDHVTIEFEAIENGEHVISIVNLQGQVLGVKQVNATVHEKTKLSFDQMGQHPPGLYVVMIETAGMRTIGKIVKM